jgi:ribonucleotide monophosphatase NagD (HAD superfamily)
MDNVAEIKGLLFDLDGVLYVGPNVIDGESKPCNLSGRME